MWQVGGRARFWWGHLRDRDQLGNLGLCEKILKKTDLQEIIWAVNWIDLAHVKPK
jgi:hypothetical protein